MRRRSGVMPNSTFDAAEARAREAMSRRGLARFVIVVLGVLAMPLLSGAQRPTKVPRLGYLTATSQPARDEAFRRELRRLGYAEPQSIIIEYRSANGRLERLPDLAAELVGLKMDVIVAGATPAALAAKKATDTIPIVMAGVSDPVGSGLIASLGRPGGNVSGTSSLAAAVVGKQLELLHEVRPTVSQVAVLWNPANRVFQTQQLAEAKAAAKLKVRLQIVEARTPDELDRALTTIAEQRTQALLVLVDSMFSPLAARIAEAAVKQRFPAVSGAKEYADAGMLLTYGPNFSDAYGRAATYVDKILKGARAADLPVEQATQFELVINARTARALGVTIPQSVVVRADYVLK